MERHCNGVRRRHRREARPQRRGARRPCSVYSKNSEPLVSKRSRNHFRGENQLRVAKLTNEYAIALAEILRFRYLDLHLKTDEGLDLRFRANNIPVVPEAHDSQLVGGVRGPSHRGRDKHNVLCRLLINRRRHHCHSQHRWRARAVEPAEEGGITRT